MNGPIDVMQRTVAQAPGLRIVLLASDIVMHASQQLQCLVQPPGPARRCIDRRMIVDVTNPLNGVEMRLTGNPVKVSDMDDVIGPVPEKGQHNSAVYGGWLGYSDERIAELAAAQVI